MVGFGGAIPTLIICGGMFLTSRGLRKKYEAYREKKALQCVNGKKIYSTSRVSEKRDNISSAVSVVPPVVYCRRCGKKLIENSTFCSYCGTEIKRSDKCEM